MEKKLDRPSFVAGYGLDLSAPARSKIGGVEGMRFDWDSGDFVPVDGPSKDQSGNGSGTLSFNKKREPDQQFYRSSNNQILNTDEAS